MIKNVCAIDSTINYLTGTFSMNLPKNAFISGIIQTEILVVLQLNVVAMSTEDTALLWEHSMNWFQFSNCIHTNDNTNEFPGTHFVYI